jgi:hypothetical protein
MASTTVFRSAVVKADNTTDYSLSSSPPGPMLPTAASTLPVAASTVTSVAPLALDDFDLEHPLAMLVLVLRAHGLAADMPLGDGNRLGQADAGFRNRRGFVFRHAMHIHGGQRRDRGHAGKRQQVDQRTVHAPPSVASFKHPTHPRRFGRATSDD